MMSYEDSLELEHYGVKGMKWDQSKKKRTQDSFISGGGPSDKQISDASQAGQNRKKAAAWIKAANRPRELVDTPYGRMTRSDYAKRAKIRYEVSKIKNSKRSEKSQERVNTAMKNLRDHQIKGLSGQVLDTGTKALSAFMKKSVKKKKP